MDTKNLNRVFAMIAFVVSLITYSLTVQPTVPFWDCGEFTSAAVQQQVPHPPGAPLFLMIGKIFHLLPIGDGADPGIRINYVSVVSTALTVMLLYLTIVMAINWMRKSQPKDMAEAIAVYGAGLVGALAYNFCDTVWFNGVESEVYAASSLFVQIIVFLMMRWNEEADNKGHEKYLLLIAYLIGLSTGVHLLSILTIFSLVYLVYFRKYEFTWSGFGIATGIGLIAFVVIYPGIVKWTPAILAGNLPFKNEAKEAIVHDNILVTLLGVLMLIGLIFGIYYSNVKKQHTLNLICTSFVLVFIGYTTYTQILIRSNANPPMNENAPKNFKALISYLGREQYGDAPNWPRRYETDPAKVRMHKKYGEWIEPTTKRVEKSDGTAIGVPEFKKTNKSGEFNFFFSYQVNHMYLRYFMWNFVGRTSDIQDTGVALFSNKDAEVVNFNNGYKDLFPIRFFALPLLLGFFGLIFHSTNDRKMWFVYLVMFLMMGVLATIQQNQQEPQPRERDYFYAGSFMVYCFWIGLGTFGLVDFFRKRGLNPALAGGIVTASLIAVPVNMAIGGWKMHSRAGNYLPFDYSYNILQSCEKNAILFTNGDNDTFPLWYLQDVAGVRRDVRIVNLSLGNTLWYVDQLKNQEPWGAQKIPLSFADNSLRVSEDDKDALSYTFGEAKDISIPIGADILKKFSTDPAVIARGTFNFVFTGQSYGQQEGKNVFLQRVQDKLILDILQQTKFTRPVYFSVTVGGDAFAGLQDFLRMEGMAYRICPVQQRPGVIDEAIMEKCLLNTLPDDKWNTEPQYGFKFRNLNNPNVFYDEVHRRYLESYRSLYMQYAGFLLNEKRDTAKVVKVLDALSDNISPKQFPVGYLYAMNIANLYADANRTDRAKEYATLVFERAQKIIENPKMAEYEEGASQPYGNPYMLQTEACFILGNFTTAREALESYKNQNGGQEDARYRLKYDEMLVRELEFSGKKSEAVAKANSLLTEYQSNPRLQAIAPQFMSVIQQMRTRLGVGSVPQPQTSTDTALK